MSIACAHNGRAVGEIFEKCLLCKRWRMIGGKTWWRQDEKPMPIAREDKPEMQDFRTWLRTS